MMLFWVDLILFSGFWVFGFSNPDGFLSLSCGGSSYTAAYNISWVSDNDYIQTGNTSMVTYIDKNSTFSVPVRFFPDTHDRQCYKVPVTEKDLSSVLIRATFVYRNYDSQNSPPAFHVSLGRRITTTVDLRTNDPWIEELVWPVNNDSLLLCLLAIKGRGIPVISSLEVRPLPFGAYRNSLEGSTNIILRRSYRINSGYTNGTIRYPLDPFDRIWDPDQSFAPSHASSTFSRLTKLTSFNITENPPASVLQTARILARTDSLSYKLPLHTLGDYYIVLYFSGILSLSPSFSVMINGEVKQSDYTVTSSEAKTLYFTQNRISTLNITLGKIKFSPQVNALEVYQILQIPPEASSTTVSALKVIEQFTGQDLGWQDDPCTPLPWNHIECEGNLVTSLFLSQINLRSISPTFGDLLDLKTLDLHNTSLTGAIQNVGSLQHIQKLNLSFNQLKSFGSELEDLANLEVLDLQNNNLQGSVPETLGKLEKLRLLNLENNNLVGPLPQSLNRTGLEVRTTGNPCLSFSSLSCNNVSSTIDTPQVTIPINKKHRKQNRIAILLGVSGGALFATFLVFAFMSICTRRQRNKEREITRAQLKMQNWNTSRIFSHKEIKSATRNLKEVIGRGSFGAVYRGKLPDGKQVAVKVRFDRTQLGADSFINEVHILSQVRHQNLVSFEGFCYEPKRQILVYEYLSGGSLADHLYAGPRSKRLSMNWVSRLKVAVDAAKGLDYLHNGSEPRIIHRDVKSSNILLDKDMNAKVSDFGLSKQFTKADASHVTTVVKGTAGYLDHEYYSTLQLTEKSDVYSFGVVLLELICGREPLSHSGSPDSFNLVLWARPNLQAGAFEIVDDILKDTFDPASMRKAASIAIRCVERDASGRPSIAEVLTKLKEAYSLQLSYLAASAHTY
ncbi:PREDICTED: probable LRR receptor-like serine/threonine-protein kinase At5g48740 isoform X1 [Camelina sativa]|uniref:non-specific serine/threonine protein kinase n=2 Tax=Camelina sativa TaxID=90675 RepID=A0ABM1QPW6_CAMSA|nr:PREDICTED: probable LRR receptor-like serine/threonine-protein kinase At5g48740 isoform X1 [Camelina sativa]